MTLEHLLKERRVLIVEDDYLIVTELVDAFEARGARVIGPAGSVAAALRLIAETPRIDAAMVDINLRGEMSFPVADALRARGVPFAFTTGYDRAAIPPAYERINRCEKPVSMAGLVEALFGASGAAARAALSPAHPA